MSMYAFKRKRSKQKQQQERPKPKPYFEQIELAKRWDKCVDAGSPLTAQIRKQEE